MSQQIFNGFCYRPYDEKKDGWMKNITRIPTSPSFEDSVKMFDDLRFYQKRVWELEQKVASLIEYVPSFPLTQTVFINGVPNVVTTYTPSSTTYKCDDGEIITR